MRRNKRQARDRAVAVITSHVTYLVNKHPHKSKRTKALVNSKETKYKCYSQKISKILQQVQCHVDVTF